MVYHEGEHHWVVVANDLAPHFRDGRPDRDGVDAVRVEVEDDVDLVIVSLALLDSRDGCLELDLKKRLTH